MTGVGGGQPGERARNEQLLATITSLVVGAAFLALWFWLLPPMLGFRIQPSEVAPWRWIAVVPSILGFAVALRCIWDFGWVGRGTPAPVAPPKRLVIAGAYRYVRNPMYIGFIIGWIGLWVIFGRASAMAVGIVAAAIVGVALFVMFYEEPTLRRKFGRDYEDYCAHVRRWWPRATPYDGRKTLDARH